MPLHIAADGTLSRLPPHAAFLAFEPDLAESILPGFPQDPPLGVWSAYSGEWRLYIRRHLLASLARGFALPTQAGVVAVIYAHLHGRARRRLAAASLSERMESLLHSIAADLAAYHYPDALYELEFEEVV